MLPGAASIAAPTLAVPVAGVGIEGEPDAISVSAIPYASGAKGTDYLTVAHKLRSRARYVIVTDARREPAVPIAACGLAYGADAMILRTAASARPVAIWGDVASLTVGDELQVVPWPGLYPPRILGFLHHSFREWAPRAHFPVELDHTIAASGGEGRAGESGSPWVRGGQVYGMHKAVVPNITIGSRERRNVSTAEPHARIQACLERVGYEQPE